MVQAIARRLRERYPGIALCLSTATDTFSARMRRYMPGVHLTYAQRDRVSALLARLPGSRREFADRDVDLFIDASGFAYGDQWGQEKLKERLSEPIRTWRRGGKAVIVLPQSLGPFSTHAFRSEMAAAIKRSDLFCARDQESLCHVAGLDPTRKVRKYPDFTTEVAADCSVRAPGNVAIVPNSKLSQSGTVERGHYVNVLATATRFLVSRGFSPFILNHAGADDAALIAALGSVLEIEVPTVHPKEARLAKGYLGQCDFVISARFHGLVSALSQNVPVVAMAWSHKYRQLLFDYGLEGYIVPVEAEPLVELLGSMTSSPGSLDDVRMRIRERNRVHLKEINEMWSRVYEIVDRVHAPTG